MSGFLLTPVTRFYAEVLQNLRNSGNAVPGAEASGQTSGAGFAGAVNEKLEQKYGNKDYATALRTCCAERTRVTLPAACVHLRMYARVLVPGLSGNVCVWKDMGNKYETAPGAAVQTGGRNEALVQSMSREEYKLYIYQKIADIPMNASQKRDAVSVNISEEGFAAMQADPAYEKWVLDTLRHDFSYYNPWSSYCGGSYRVHYFGATKAEYRGESYSMGFRNGGRHTDSSKKKKEKSFWEKRAERHKLYMDMAQKAWYKHENEREYQENIDLHRRELSSASLQQWSLERATGEKAELGVNPSVLSEASADFTQGYVFFKIPSALVNPKPKSVK